MLEGRWKTGLYNSSKTMSTYEDHVELEELVTAPAVARYVMLKAGLLYDGWWEPEAIWSYSPSLFMLSVE